MQKWEFLVAVRFHRPFFFRSKVLIGLRNENYLWVFSVFTREGFDLSFSCIKARAVDSVLFFFSPFLSLSLSLSFFPSIFVAGFNDFFSLNSFSLH